MIKKRKVVWLLGSVLLLLAASAFAQTDITIGQVMGAPGRSATVQITGTGDDIAGVNFTITYDSAVLSNPVVAIPTGALSEGFLLDQNVPQDGEVRAVIYPESAPIPTFTTGAGVIAEITFDIAQGATQCTPSAVEWDLGTPTDPLTGVSDENGSSITGDYNFVTGQIQTTIPGDFNADGSVNLSDFTILVAGWGVDYSLSDFTLLVANWNTSCP